MLSEVTVLQSPNINKKTHWCRLNPSSSPKIVFWRLFWGGLAWFLLQEWLNHEIKKTVSLHKKSSQNWGHSKKTMDIFNGIFMTWLYHQNSSSTTWPEPSIFSDICNHQNPPQHLTIFHLHKYPGQRCQYKKPRPPKNFSDPPDVTDLEIPRKKNSLSKVAFWWYMI